MPLVAFSDLPTFQRLLDDRHDVLSLEKATHQDIREQHIGILNMMPDASLQATERQFMRLVGDCNQIVQFYIHLFTIPAIKRGAESQEWIDNYYEDFESIKKNGLDALIITGANPASDDLEQEAFWPMLTEVIDWANDHVTSTLCACLSTHAVVQYLYGIKRQRLKQKKWGVYKHRVTDELHPLTRHINTRFDIPHSRFNQITKQQLLQSGVKVLVESDDSDVHLAVSPDGLRLVFFQGHPEYDSFSLLKEYKREIDDWFNQTRSAYPSFPENYFNDELQQALMDYQAKAIEAKNSQRALPKWDEAWILKQIDNTWRDTTLSTFNNWLGMVYKLTHKDVSQHLMPGIDPDNPLNPRAIDPYR